MKRTLQIEADQKVEMSFVDALGIPKPTASDIVIHTSDPEIAMMRGQELIPTGRKFGRVKVFMICPRLMIVLDKQTLKVVEPSKNRFKISVPTGEEHG